ncbi:hypothetical protein NQ318_005248 [Aromia moschata]|uniref:Hyaluronan mediated motility receptor n=1 Tax=Aromia moschata TaxID=1265417 RepID=A0AAV8Y1U5_9CUCU|nr:hypothetical protein NQ318_005248 [Aromia moschata]
MEENLKSSNFFTEVQLKEKLDELETAWRIKLGNQEKQAEAILKECQAISEYAVIQCEIEKNGIRNDLADKTNELETVQLKYDQIVQDYEELNTKFKALQCDLSNIIIELNETRSTMGEKLDAKMKELKRFADEKKAYEVTIKNSQVTIDVLTRRLMNSDRDVEQLKHELQDTEAKTLEYESKCLQLTNDLKQAQTFNEELEMQYESAIKLNTTEIQQLKSELVQKVEAYRAEAESSTKKLHDSQELTKEVIQMLQETHSQMETQLEHLENVNAQCKFECEQSQNELEDYRIREMDWNDEREKLENVVKEMENLLEIKQDEVGELRRQLAQAQECSDARQIQMQFYKRKVAECEKELDESAHINRRYIEQSGKYDELLQKFEQLEMENLKNKNRCLKLDDEVEGNGHWKSEYDKQREDYEQLLAKCEGLEKENDSNKKKMEEQRSSQKILEGDKDALSSRVHYLENELKQLSEKYADLVGHHNTKQKIRHLADLKAKTEELTQTNMDLEVKLQAQQKTLEKLKKENADMKKCLKRNKVYAEDKENVGSPNRSLNSSRIESPFRERN